MMTDPKTQQPLHIGYRMRHSAAAACDKSQFSLSVCFICTKDITITEVQCAVQCLGELLREYTLAMARCVVASIRNAGLWLARQAPRLPPGAGCTCE